MATTEELAGLIRFALNELSGRNGHHEFEELCRHLARARIATNVLPATGPVGAGGDQGRDLETFRTYLANELGPHGAFLALASSDTIAFACTLQRDGLSAKVLGDVEKIMSAGTRVDRVVAFLGGELPVAARHELQETARERFGVTLEIFDARAIAEELAQADTFWIAERYLSLPAEIGAPPDDDVESPEWYREEREAWRERTPQWTLADLLAIKAALRRATFHTAQRADLPFWLDLMRHFLDQREGHLAQRARYEIAVATLRGAGDLTPVDGLTAEFMDHACESEDLTVLEDGNVLLMYCLGAYVRGRTGLTAPKLTSWNSRLRDRVSRLLEAGLGPNRRAILLQILGGLCIQPDPNRVEVREAPVPDPAVLLNENGDLNVADLDLGDVEEAATHAMFDVDAGMEAWLELTHAFDEATLFPAERFANQLSVLTPLLVDHPLYREITDAVDERVVETAGRGAAASQCRDRAIALRRAERYTAALAEFHQAKVGWWSGDYLRGSLLAMLLIADCYEQLGYLHAAKHSALLAARVAADSGDEELLDLFAQGVCIAAHLDYGLGAWNSSAETAESGLMLHSNFVSELDPDDPRVERMVFELMWTYSAAQDLAPPLADRVQRLLERAGMWDEVSSIIDDAGSRTPEEWLEVADGQLLGEFLCDLKDEVRVSFSGLGTTWTVTGANESSTLMAIERFAGAAQVLLAELAGQDLAILQTEIQVKIKVGADANGDDRVRPIPSNEGRHWEVQLAPWTTDVRGNEEPLRIELLVALSTILAEASVLPEEEFMKSLEDAFRQGLTHKIGFGPALDELLVWRSHEDYEGLAGGVMLPEVIEVHAHQPMTHPELAWQHGPGPTYDEADAIAAINLRYERVTELFPFTLDRLRSSPEFLHIVEEVRARGWRDWHVLNAIASAATNHRMQMLGLDRFMGDPGPKGEEARTAFQMLAFEPETSAMEDVPLSVFSLENLDLNRIAGLPVFLRGVGLDVHQRTPDIPAIEQFLAVRYRYWDDDVPHADPFEQAS